MRNISIDFISQNDIRICIDGEKLEDVSGFSLEMKIGENEKYSIEKNIFKQPKELKVLTNHITPRLRSIPEVVKALKKEDPDTSITTSSIRSLVKEGEISAYPKGKQVQVDLDEIEEYYRNKAKVIKAKPKRKLEPIF